MAKSIFILSTPSQAFFLSLTPELVEEAILVLTVKTEEDARKLLDYVCDLKWTKIYTWYIPKSNNRSEYLKFLFLRINFWKFRKSYPKITKIFFGSYVNQYHLSFLSEFEKNSKLFLLYDGLQMIAAAHFRKNNLPLIQEHPLMMRLLSFKKPQLKTLTYVSPISFNLPDNDFVYLINSSKTLKQKTYDPNVVYFIGQPISKSGIGVVGVKFYLKVLYDLVRHHPNKEIIYVAHPRENKEILNLISNIMRIEKLQVIFELFYLQSDRLPLKIYSFYSSVLLNLLFLGTEGEIISLRIPDFQISETFREKIRPIYDYFRTISSPNFKLIDVQEIR